MAVRGIESAIYSVRNGGAVCWRIYESAQKRTNGGFIAQSKESDLSMDASMSDLYNALSRLTPGCYLLVSFKENAPNKPVVDINVEIGYDERRQPATGGIGSTFSLEGIGQVTPENFEAALEKKLNDLLEKRKKEDELLALKARIKELELQERENGAGFKKGIASIGAALYPIMSKTPAFKEVVSTINGIVKNVSGDDNNTVENAEVLEGDISVGGVNDAEERIGAAVELLAKNNPNIVKELEMLAKLKEQNPSLYKEGVDFAESMAND